MLGFIDKITTTKWNYWSGFAVDALAIVLLMTVALKRADLSQVAIVASFASGYLFFTFIEYLIHARLFHGKPGKLTRVFIVGHWMHHKNPTGYDSLPFFFASSLAVLMVLILSQFVSLSAATAFSGGFLSGYVVYGLFHHLIHHTEWKRGYMAYMQGFHQRHHLNPKTNMGVTSPIWDVVFRTGNKN